MADSNGVKKVAVVTGGCGQVGRELVPAMASEGWRVFVPWRNRSSWEELAVELEDQDLLDNCCDVETDLADEAGVRELFATVKNTSGRLDALVNLAGMFRFGTKVHDLDLADWQKIMDANLTGVFLSCKHALPLMFETGAAHIVNTASKAAADIQPGAGAYAVAKAGVITLTRALREELKDSGIQVNVLMPGVIDTSTTRKIMPGGDFASWVKPAEIVEVVMNLCEGRMDGVSGSVLKLFGRM